MSEANRCDCGKFKERRKPACGDCIALDSQAIAISKREAYILRLYEEGVSPEGILERLDIDPSVLTTILWRRGEG